MTYYAITIEANNLLIQDETSEQAQISGCFCTRYVEADDLELAILKAKEIVIGELNEQGITYPVNDLIVESTEQISEFPDNGNSSESGFTFYLGD